jgi:molybdate transport system substrate-binding protein
MRGHGFRNANLGRPRVPLIGLLAAIVSVMPAQAQEVRVLAAGAVQGAIQRLEPFLAAAGGRKLAATFDTVGALRERVLAGTPADVVILSEAGMAALAKAGKIDAGAMVDLGRTSVALAVRKGAVVPDVGAPEALKRALLSAASIAHADPARGATAGAHFASVLQRLGIADELRGRVVVLGFGGDVIAGVAEGRFAIGVSQSSEIIAHPGVVLAGRLPEPYAHHTRYLAAKVTGASPAAEAFLALLGSPQGRAALLAIGFAAP